MTAVAAAAGALALARHRRTKQPQLVPLVPGEDLPHDGMRSRQRQRVRLEGGPSDGADVSLDWDVREHTIQDQNRTNHHYRLTAETRPRPDGEAMQVFAHVEPGEPPG